MTTANTKTQAESFTGNLFLIGFMGSGKSTIAAELSRMLHRPVLEMDEEIENGKVCPSLLSFLNTEKLISVSLRQIF